MQLDVVAHLTSDTIVAAFRALVAGVAVVGALAVGVALAHRDGVPARLPLAPVGTDPSTDPTAAASTTSVVETVQPAVPATTEAVVTAVSGTRPVLADVATTVPTAPVVSLPGVTTTTTNPVQIGAPCDTVGAIAFAGSPGYAVEVVCTAGSPPTWQRTTP